MTDYDTSVHGLEMQKGNDETKTTRKSFFFNLLFDSYIILTGEAGRPRELLFNCTEAFSMKKILRPKLHQIQCISHHIPQI